METRVFRSREYEVLVLGTNFRLKQTEDDGVELTWKGPPPVFWPADSEGWDDVELTVRPEI